MAQPITVLKLNTERLSLSLAKNPEGLSLEMQQKLCDQMQAAVERLELLQANRKAKLNRIKC